MSIPILCLAFHASILTLAPPAQEVRVELEPPGASDVGAPLALRVVGLPAEREVVLFSQKVDRYGRLWTGAATFRSSAEGVVDPALQAPLEAAWQGVDALGPLWALERKTMRGAHPPPEGGAAERIAFSALVDGRPVATAAALRWSRRPDVEELTVDAPGVVARLFCRPGDEPRAAVVVVPGSGGGLPTQSAEQLASRGYAALALAYFGEPGLPAELDRVPLEYFDRALDWLAAHPRVDAERIALLGGSKGGELVLLLGTRRPDLRAIVAVVPGSAVFQSIADDWPRTSSWSVDGEGLPFVPYANSTRFRESGRLSFLYEDSLENIEALERAAIAVERARCPILLISGRDDWMWPATAMCDQVVARLQRAEYSHPVVHLAYDDAGHEVFGPGYGTVSWSPRVGGTRAGHAKARAQVWGELWEFLDAHLGD